MTSFQIQSNDKVADNTAFDLCHDRISVFLVHC
jgi:hypothetical protein